MGFDIMDLQRGRGQVQARSKVDEGRAVLKYIDVEDLVPSEDNFYSMSAIDELAGLIELSGGVKQPGLVVPLGGGKYKVISGHRRRLASLQLVKQGKEVYRKMPCMVEDVGKVRERDEHEKMGRMEMDAGMREDEEADELRAIDEAILLITTNGQREKTDWDKVQEATRLRALLEEKRRFEKIPGEMRKLIAGRLGTTPAQVGRYDSIEKHLIPVFKTWLEEGKIGISVAYELSVLPKDVQRKAAAESCESPERVTLEDVREWKQEAEQKPKKETTADAEQETTGAAEGVPPSPLPPPKNVYVRTEPTKLTTVPPDGKIVDFPAPPSPLSAPSAEAAAEPEKDVEWAALMLKTLRNYCETMAAVKGGQTVPWAEYAEAVDIVLSTVRK